MSNSCEDGSPLSKKLSDMSLEEKKVYVSQNIEWTFDAIKYIYDNCDEDSEFGEMIFDAYLLFSQARTAIHSLLSELNEACPSRQDKH